MSQSFSGGCVVRRSRRAFLARQERRVLWLLGPAVALLGAVSIFSCLAWVAAQAGVLETALRGIGLP